MLISKFDVCDVNSEIEKLEGDYNIILPYQYKKFLSKYNGGYTPKTKFTVGKISSDIRGFYGVGNVNMSLNSMELEEWITLDTLPIACDSFGNYILISLAKESEGKIIFYNHEEENKMDFIADDFEKFMKYCKSEEISEASRKSIKEREMALTERGRGDIITDALRQMWQSEIDKYQNMVQEEVSID